MSGFRVDDFGVFALDRADAEVFVFLEDLMTVEVVECRSGVLAGDLLKNDRAARVGVDEVAKVVNFVVDLEMSSVFSS